MTTEQSERAILGCLIQYPAQFGGRLAGLSPELFSDSVRRDVFAAICAASRKTPHYDAGLVIANLTHPDAKAEVCRCAEIAYASTPFDEHLQVLIKRAQHRFICDRVAPAFSDSEVTPDTLREIAEDAERAFPPQEIDGATVYDRYADNYHTPRVVLMTRIRRLDALTGGLICGTVAIIGAQQGSGKTALALNIAANIAQFGRRVIFFSLEMTAGMILDRLIAAGLNMDYRDVQQRRLKPDIAAQIGDYFARSGLKENMIVYDREPMTVESMCDLIHTHKPALAVIDFIQIVQTRRKIDNLRERIDYITASLKQTAKRTGCVVLLLSQLRRYDADHAQKPKPPTMSDLKESSGLEQQGDYVFLLWRPFAQYKELGAKSRPQFDPSDATLICAKNKFGCTNRLNLHFDGAHQKFTEVIEP